MQKLHERYGPVGDIRWYIVNGTCNPGGHYMDYYVDTLSY